MVGGEINFHQFQAEVLDKELPNIANGKLVPCKVVSVKDGHSELRINLIFTGEMLEKFIEMLSERKVIEAHTMPEAKIVLPNGRVRHG